MQFDSDAIYDAALKLSEADRLALISRLMETMPVENLALSLDDPEFARELERRFADQNGSIPWSDLRSEG